MGLLKPSPMTLENHLDFILRAMESQHLNGLEQGGMVREEKEQKHPLESVQQS